MDDPNCLLLRYEDYVFQKRRLVNKIVRHFNWTCTEGQLEHIMGNVDKMPTGEEKTSFIRRVIPGDHVTKLSRETIRRLNNILAEVMQRVRAEYVDPVDDHDLVDNALRGMVAGLDPYSAYLDREEYDEVRLNTTGTYPGIGVEVAAEEQGIKVLRPIEDSPADRAGIRSGDLIVRIDGAPVAGPA